MPAVENPHGTRTSGEVCASAKPTGIRKKSREREKYKKDRRFIQRNGSMGNWMGCGLFYCGVLAKSAVAVSVDMFSN
jgi:hypothetical protein